jgi:nitrite reductase/ring-hydroxylating ferredoxin subunit
MATYTVARVSEIPPGHRKIVELGGRSIGVFNVGGHFHALRNQCPHQGGPLCQGSIQGTAAASSPGEYRWEREGEILRCPWHGWEFDITSGRSVFNPHKVRVRRYDVTLRLDDEDEEGVEKYAVSVRDGVVLVHL